MQLLKTQLEVRYSPILNFDNLYREKLPPFLKNYEISITPGDLAPIIALTNKEQLYSLDIRWDKIIFVSEGAIDLKNANGPLFHFFEILSAFQASPYFGDVKNALLAQWFLKDSDLVDNFTDAVAKYSNRYLTEDAKFSINGYTKSDYTTVMDFTTEKKSLKYTFGPFDNKADSERYNLCPISKRIDKFENMYGLFIEGVYHEFRTVFEHSTFKSFSKNIEDQLIRFHL